MPQLKDQKGTVSLLLLISAIAVIVFLGFSSLAPFRDKLLSVLYRKPDSFAASGNDTSYTLGVLVIKYYPVDSTSQNLDSSITGFNRSLSQIRSFVDDITNRGINQMTNGSKYHGFKDPTAQPAITYQVNDTKEYLEALPVSTFGSPPQPDYRKILNRENICDYVDNKGVRQVWLWGYHTNAVAPVESDMSMGTDSKAYWNRGTYGDISNSAMIDDLPVCKKTYVLYNYNYERGLPELLEDHGHQIEEVMKFLDSTLWDKFVNPHGLTDGTVNHCGWTHSPPNVTDAEQYRWDEERSVLSDCEDWKPEGGGESKMVNCYTWNGPACVDGGINFKVWWMQNIPGKLNPLTYQGKKMRNWWDFYADFDTALASGKSLVIPEPTQSASPTNSTITLQVNATYDDVNEINGKFDSNYHPFYSQLWIGNAALNEDSWTGLRFKNIPTPKNAKIESAQLEVFNIKDQWINMDASIAGELVSSSAEFNSSSLPSKRQLTSKKVSVNTNDKWLDNRWYVLADVTEIVQEIVNQSNWQYSNSLSFLIHGIGRPYGRKFIASFDGSPGYAPKLTINYNLPTPTPTPTPIIQPSPSPQGRFVRVTYPNGGESFKIGERVDVRWTSNDVDFCNIGYSRGVGSLDWIANLNDNPGILSWNVNMGYVVLPTQAKIYALCYKRGVGSVDDYSDSFFAITP